MSQVPAPRKNDEERVNWGVFMALFGLASIAFLIWLAFFWHKR